LSVAERLNQSNHTLIILGGKYNNQQNKQDGFKHCSASLALLAFAAIMGQEAQSQGQVGIHAAMNTAFTYQGELKKDGQAITDICEMAFRLYEQETGDNQVGSAITTTVPVTAGLFTVKLDFG